MKYVFYADSFFALNFMLDYLLLIFVGKLTGHRITTSYLWGAAIGAAGALLHILIPLRIPVLSNLFAYGGTSFIMCAVAYREKRKRELFKDWVCLFAAAFFAGGAISSVYYYTNFRYVLNTILKEPYLKSIRLSDFILASVITYLLGELGIYFYRNWSKKTGNARDYVEVIITHKGLKTQVVALYDSGNSLREPISGKPVHLIDLETADHIIKGGQRTEEKWRVVPFHSVGKEKGVLTAFECGKLELLAKGRTIDLGPAYLGIVRGTLTAGKKYRIILNRSINQWL